MSFSKMGRFPVDLHLDFSPQKYGKFDFFFSQPRKIRERGLLSLLSILTEKHIEDENNEFDLESRIRKLLTDNSTRSLHTE